MSGDGTVEDERVEDMRWRITPSQNVQVESYPELVASRADDWNWR